jgi:CheY-like chemotaxis protein
MKYMGKHRDVDFVVFHLRGVWKYTVGNETRGHYPEQAHAIHAVIKHIDEVLFGMPEVRSGRRGPSMSSLLAGCSIFVLECDATDANRLRSVLKAVGAEVSFAFSPGEALVRLERLEFDIAILDGVDCVDVCKALGGIPCVFHVKRRVPQVFPAWLDTPVLIKPAPATVIIETVAMLVGRGGSADALNGAQPSPLRF